jgi:hypothetical protein
LSYSATPEQLALRDAAVGSLRALGGAQAQVQSQQVGGDLQLSALDVRDDLQMFAQGFLEAVHADRRKEVRQAPQALVLEQGVTDKTIAAALAEQFVEADVQFAKLLDIEMLYGAREQGLHSASQ